MARAYSGMLGIFAWSLVVLRGLMMDLQTNHILITGLVIFSIFAALGFCIGKILDEARREGSEHRLTSETAQAKFDGR